MENEIMTKIIPKLVEIKLRKKKLLKKFNKEISIELVDEKIVGDNSMIYADPKDVLDTRWIHLTYSISTFGQQVDTITLGNEVYLGRPNLKGVQELYELYKAHWYNIIISIFNSEDLSKIMFKKFKIKKDDFYSNNCYAIENINELLDTKSLEDESLKSQKKKMLNLKRYIKHKK